MRIFLYSLQTALKNLLLEKWINILTILTIAVGLLMLATFILITANVDSALKRWSKGFGLVVYLGDDVTSDDENLLTEYFRKDPDIAEIKYVSKDLALNEFRQTLGSMSSIIEGFEENPLPSSFELKLKKNILEPELIRQKALQIEKLSAIEDVQYGEKWLSSLYAMVTGMKIVVTLLGGIIFVAISFVTYSTIKILFYRRKEEIETLKLLGATRTFIRLPFLLEALFMGVAGGALSLLSLLLLYSFASARILEFFPAFGGVMTFFGPETYPVPALAGAFMSLVGSFFAIGRIRY